MPCLRESARTAAWRTRASASPTARRRRCAPPSPTRAATRSSCSARWPAAWSTTCACWRAATAARCRRSCTCRGPGEVVIHNHPSGRLAAVRRRPRRRLGARQQRRRRLHRRQRRHAGLRRRRAAAPRRRASSSTAPPRSTLLAPGGAVGAALAGYEHRPQQLAMLRAVSDAFNDDEVLSVEAGTGTGKSLAYLVPGDPLEPGQQATRRGLDPHHQPAGAARQQGPAAADRARRPHLPHRAGQGPRQLPLPAQSRPGRGAGRRS